MKSGLSAGRVQSIATKIIVEREDEIRAFVPREYWTVDAVLTSDGRDFTAHYYGEAGSKDKNELSAESEAVRIKEDCFGKKFVCTEIKKGNRRLSRLHSSRRRPKSSISSLSAQCALPRSFTRA